MKKKIIIFLFILALLILFFPLKFTYLDGGSKEYKALLYQIIVWHRLDDNYASGYKEGTEIHYFPHNFHSIDYYDDLIPNRLLLNIEDGEDHFKTNMGSYCWTEERESKTFSTCVDTISPLEMEYEDILKVNANKKVFFGNLSGNINKITIYKDKELNEEIKYTNEYFVVPKLKGEYIIKIDVKANEGNIWFSFKIDIG